MRAQLVLYFFLFVGIYSEETDEAKNGTVADPETDETKDMAHFEIDKDQTAAIKQHSDIDRGQTAAIKQDSDINNGQIAAIEQHSNIDRGQNAAIKQHSDIDRDQTAAYNEFPDIYNNPAERKELLDKEIAAFRQLEFLNNDLETPHFQKFETLPPDLVEIDPEKWNVEANSNLNEYWGKGKETETNEEQLNKLLKRSVFIVTGLVLFGVGTCVLKLTKRRKKSDDKKKLWDDTSESDSVQPNSSAPQEI